ncbi:Bifunctional acetohydroxyacid reductoisomerase, partial [Fusarium falciforme]
MLVPPPPEEVLGLVPNLQECFEACFPRLVRIYQERYRNQEIFEFNSQPDYREKLEKELDTIRNMEIWKV